MSSGIGGRLVLWFCSLVDCLDDFINTDVNFSVWVRWPPDRDIFWTKQETKKAGMWEKIDRMITTWFFYHPSLSYLLTYTKSMQLIKYQHFLQLPSSPDLLMWHVQKPISQICHCTDMTIMKTQNRATTTTYSGVPTTAYSHTTQDNQWFADNQ